MIDKLSQLFDIAKGSDKKIAVAAAEDEIVLKAVKEAIERDLAEFVLFGDATELKKLCTNVGLSEGFKIVHAASTSEAVTAAVEAVACGKADLLMKGKIKTGELLSVYLKEEYGLRAGRTMNLVSVFEIPGFDRLLIVTDAGMVIAPSLKQKVDSIVNASKVAAALGIDNPKVAILGAIEVVNEKMPATIDAAILSKMAHRNQIPDVIVDGPLALDNAISEEAARHKGIDSPVAGKADILIMPDIEAGNIFYKAMVFLGGALVASTIMGGKAPIVLTSRADSDLTKLLSIALNVLIAKGASK
ncbi:bifunctional enoyl-CoA hydratase/phosphate acetyltransferase [Kosmotoga pacifica]|uniref:Phosphate butyryltransferase n=1 Tax=Kosmotoga pacifica TaxID=1330330 RepID=A0A0G2ZF43_9BACT|nr:bifunctional enoyl-CoA hydratase/phosphate acetyltransferase [Kosmotoga pacifica]AKI98159.1 phosphate butyryltransferase [Kosmotoga pacifica]